MCQCLPFRYISGQLLSRQSLGNITFLSPLSQCMSSGSFNTRGNSDWEVTNSDTWIYRGLFWVLLYISDEIYWNISIVTIMEKIVYVIWNMSKLDKVKLNQFYELWYREREALGDCWKSLVFSHSFRIHLQVWFGTCLQLYHW